jgi:effector-binding domain-containing protein
MSFVVPSEVAKKGAPAPAAGDVKVETLPAGRWAVYRFSGRADAAMEKEALDKLRTWMAGRKLTATGSAITAFFDPPWTPGPMRRNEVMLPVAAAPPATP